MSVAASDLSYSEESLRTLFLAALAHDLLTPFLY
jgi:K+-sensing histidine kinase KdpD